MDFNSSNYLLQSSKEYAIYVCTTRAIPHAGDGLKHVQRMVLWVLRNRSEKIKTAALTGLLGYEKLHVHGEKSANDAIGLLAAPYKNNIPLVEGLGQFGSRTAPDGEGIGAPRYTEVKRAKAAEHIMYHDLDIIPMGENYDGSHPLPHFFLPYIPVVLLNGVSGVAVGYSTDILPHNIKDIINATKAALNDEPIQKLIPYFEKYDITVEPTEKINQWVFYGKVEMIDHSTFRIVELPPGFDYKKYQKKLIAMEDEELIQSYIDKSTDKIDIVIKMKRGTIANWTERDAIDFMKLKETTTERIVVLDFDGERIKTYSSPEDLIKDFVAWRLGWYKKRYEKLINDNTYELGYWCALQLLFNSDFPKKLGSFKNKKEMREDIVVIIDQNKPAYMPSSDQIEKIISTPTYYWTKETSNKVDDTIIEILTNIDKYKTILADPKKLKKVYLKDINELEKKYQ